MALPRTTLRHRLGIIAGATALVSAPGALGALAFLDDAAVPTAPAAAQAAAAASGDTDPITSATAHELARTGALGAAPTEATDSADWTLDVTGHCAGAACAQTAVDTHPISYVDFGEFVTIAGHDYGPAGVIESMQVGDTVELHGHGEGTYVITAEQYVPKGAAIDVVTGDMALQTCCDDQTMVLKYIRAV